MGIEERINTFFEQILSGNPEGEAQRAREILESLIAVYGQEAYDALVAKRCPSALVLIALASGLPCRPT